MVIIAPNTISLPGQLKSFCKKTACTSSATFRRQITKVRHVRLLMFLRERFSYPVPRNRSEQLRKAPSEKCATFLIRFQNVFIHT